ncbi:hypothetical protein KHQ06_06620 [Nocardia tengchongensis]|uniref:Tudor domain-containing protein n=1 Tax=Nocardia tengchongensis TaxID=2055889 RepID=A0ABX8CRZ7_9NOCA|nr:hypothetical protein [Nocardia tengchongensis]QVI22686.1 hypothetical protein KHQ06_06620 [Nocardia tengchongensis]
MASTSLLPIYDDLAADRVAYVDVDLTTGEWYEVLDVGDKLKTGVVLAAFKKDSMVQKVIIKDDAPEAVQYLDVSDVDPLLRWHANNYPGVRGEIWSRVELEEFGSLRKGFIMKTGDCVSMVIIERSDIDGDLTSEELCAPAGI